MNKTRKERIVFFSQLKMREDKQNQNSSMFMNTNTTSCATRPLTSLDAAVGVDPVVDQEHQAAE